MVTASIDFNINDSPPSVIAFLKRSAAIRSVENAEWSLDLTNCLYLGPDSAAIIVADFLAAKRAGKTCNVQLPVGSLSLNAFLNFSGLKHLLTGSEPPTEDHPESVTIPIQVRTVSKFDDPDPIVQLVRRHAAISDEAEEYLRICINEVVQNVEDHARSPVGCVTCARFMRNAKEVRVAIVDYGRGICTTLQGRYPFIQSATNALSRVLGGGYSAKSRPNNMGVGMSNLCNIVTKQLHGELFIISQNAFADVKGAKSPVINPLGTDFPGTGVFFTIPVQ